MTTTATTELRDAIADARRTRRPITLPRWALGLIVAGFVVLVVGVLGLALQTSRLSGRLADSTTLRTTQLDRLQGSVDGLQRQVSADHDTITTQALTIAAQSQEIARLNVLLRAAGIQPGTPVVGSQIVPAAVTPSPATSPTPGHAATPSSPPVPATPGRTPTSVVPVPARSVRPPVQPAPVSTPRPATTSPVPLVGVTTPPPRVSPTRRPPAPPAPVASPAPSSSPSGGVTVAPVPGVLPPVVLPPLPLRPQATVAPLPGESPTVIVPTVIPYRTAPLPSP